ncbi:hypothetical protein ACLESO_28605 [Pyxidicoccus sp. 3LG]
MLTVRRVQMAELSRARRGAFIDVAVGQVVRHWPAVSESLSSEALRAHVERVVEAGAALGLDTEGELLRYVNVALALGDGSFREAVHPEAAAIEAGAWTPRQKLEKLVGLARRELRRRAV